MTVERFMPGMSLYIGLLLLLPLGLLLCVFCGFLLSLFFVCCSSVVPRAGARPNGKEVVLPAPVMCSIANDLREACFVFPLSCVPFGKTVIW